MDGIALPFGKMTRESLALPDVLTIRGSWQRQALAVSASIGFLVVGVLMLLLPPPAKSVLPWSEAGQGAVGVLAILFGGVGLAVMLYVASRPILHLRPDGLTDYRRRVDIPFADILSVSTTSRQSGLTGQYIHLKLLHPQQYASLERLSKRSGQYSADLTLDLSLADSVDFQRACRYIEQHVR
ncbi:MAG: STM3941 family protein [Anaerolineae bacterium]